MSQTQTNFLVDRIDWFSGGRAATQANADGMEVGEQEATHQGHWARKARRSSLVTTAGQYAFLAGCELGPAYMVTDAATLRDPMPFLTPGCPPEASQDATEDDVVFCFPPRSRVTIRAAVHVRPGQFALILPDSLLDDED
jgi:hypothetical protein